MARKSFRVGFVYAGAAALMIVAVPVAALAGPPQGVTQNIPSNSAVVFAEDFDHGDGQTPVNLTHYLGVDGAHYQADGAWLPSFGACNGWVANASSAQPVGDLGCLDWGGLDAGGTQQSAWWFVQRMATALGVAQGQPAVQTFANNAVSAITSGRAQPGDYQFQTSYNYATGVDVATAESGHHYFVSVYLAAVHCHGDPGDVGWTDPSENVYLMVDGTPVKAASGLDPCVADPTGTVVADGEHSVLVHVAQFTSAPVLVSSTASLGMALSGSTRSSVGNDLAFDLPQIIDVA